MRTFITLLLILAIVAGAIAIYLYVTTPHETAGVAFPLSSRAHAAIASVPASAEVFAYIPSAAGLEATMSRNPITRDVIDSWRKQHTLPRPWMIGNADLVVWQEGKQTRYLLQLDPVRGAIVRMYDSGGTILINAPAEGAIAADEVARIEALASKLPAGDALVVQRTASRGAYPPIGRPSVSSVKVAASEIDITSRSESAAGGGGAPLSTHFAKNAILAASFASAPRVFDDLNRLFGKRVSDLVSDGGSISLYDIDTGTFLPRPRGVISLPRRPGADILEKIGARTAEKGDELVISFDDSIDAYLKDATDVAAVPNGRWAARIDAERMAPILDRLRDNVGLRIAAPRLFRAARDLERWIGGLQRARTIDATDTSDGSVEELKVRVTAK